MTQNRPDDLTLLIPALQRLARILAPTPDMAEDMAQDALLNVWRKMHSGVPIENIRPYLMTTLRNSRKRPAVQTCALSDENTPTEMGSALPRLACADVTRAIGHLPKDQAAVLVPLIQSGTSYKDLAKQLNLPLGTVMSRLNRARAHLRNELGLPKSRAVEALLKETLH